MKVVQFRDGTFGVRRWRLLTGYQFLDIKSADYWWTDQDYVNRYSRAATIDLAKNALSMWTITQKMDIGTPV